MTMKNGKPCVLGLKCGGNPNGDGHSANAAIKCGNEIVAIQAERLDRIKKSAGWKKGTKNFESLTRNDCEFVGIKDCVQYCLDAFGISNQNIDLVVTDNIGSYEEQEKEIRQIIGNICPIVQISHHLAHAASAFLCSPFSHAAIFVVDGGGGCLDEFENSFERQSVYVGNGRHIEHLHTTRSNNENVWGIGGAYNIISNILALDPGKVMGLAAYGDAERYCRYKILELKNTLDCYLESSVFQGKDQKEVLVTAGNNVFGMLRRWEENPVDHCWADLAAKVQLELEFYMIKICNEIHRITGEKNLCISGGVGLNSSVNEKIINNTPFEEVFIQPASDDGGIGLGCALYGDAIIFSRDRDYVMENAYLGRSYTTKEIEKSLGVFKNKLSIKKSDNIAVDCANLLAEGNIVAWFQGKAEYGPRALGHRSLLCDPRSIHLRDVMNVRVKGREWWRPLAPSVLQEYAQEYFEVKNDSPFMLRVAKVIPEKANLIPGVKHIDNTSRIQTVTYKDNGIYWELIRCFYEKTGIPMVLNTSFNICNEPIVETPIDAIESFLRKPSINYLVLHNFIIRRK